MNRRSKGRVRAKPCIRAKQRSGGVENGIVAEDDSTTRKPPRPRLSLIRPLFAMRAASKMRLSRLARTRFGFGAY